MLTWDDLNAAFKQAKADLDRGDQIAGQMAEQLVGRLRRANVSSHTLAKLKRELSNYDATRRRWKEGT